MRLVWVVIPLVLVVSMIGIGGIQNSYATVCFGTEVYTWPDALTFLGTVQSSKVIAYDEPFFHMDGRTTHYALHDFQVDEILIGVEDKKNIVVKDWNARIGDELEEDSQYMIVALKGDEYYDADGCSGIIVSPDKPIVTEFKKEIESHFIPYFVENGFEIYTLHEPYGEYYIPFKANNVELNSISYYNSTLSYNGTSSNITVGHLINIDAKKNSTLTLLIPRFLLYTDSYSEKDEDLGIFTKDFSVKLSEFEQKHGPFYSTIEIKFPDNTKEWAILTPTLIHNKPIDSLIKHNLKTTDSMYFDLFSPKQQIKNGIGLGNVICKVGLELIFKSSDNSPACVTSSTAEKLTERGWARDRGPIYTELLSPEECKEQGGKYNHCPPCPEGAFCEPCTEFCRIE